MREKRCRILRTLAKDMKATKVTPLSKNHKEKCIRWSKKMKTDFSTVIFSGDVELNWIDLVIGSSAQLRKQQEDNVLG